MSRKEWHHECREMPENISFYKVDFCEYPSFVLDVYKGKEYCTRTTLYDFKYCPYCGEKVVNDE